MGGGIAGCTAAFELARRGARVTLLEQRSIAWAASGRNNGGLMNTSDPTTVEIMHQSREIYRELAEGPVSFDLRQRDSVRVASDESQLVVARERAAGLAAVGEEVEEVDSGWLQREVGWLRLQAVGGFLLRGTWTMTPALATAAFADAARRAGAEIRCGVRVLRVEQAGGRLTGLTTDAGPIAADVVVLAGGPWLPDLLPELPIAAARGWLLRLTAVPGRLDYSLQESAWADLDELGRVSTYPTLSEVAEPHYDRPVSEMVLLGPLPDGDVLLGASMARSLVGAVEGVDMPRRLAARALAMAPGLAGARVRASWYGMRPMTPDGRPVVGATAVEGLYVNGGQGSVGMMVAPAASHWLAASIEAGRGDARLAGYDPRRFLAGPT